MGNRSSAAASNEGSAMLDSDDEGAGIVQHKPTASPTPTITSAVHYETVDGVPTIQFSTQPTVQHHRSGQTPAKSVQTPAKLSNGVSNHNNAQPTEQPAAITPAQTPSKPTYAESPLQQPMSQIPAAAAPASTPVKAAQAQAPAAARKEWWSDALASMPITTQLLRHPPSTLTPADEEWLANFSLDQIMHDAKLMLNTHKELPIVRYKLVPAKVSEYVFWKNLLLHLHQYQSRPEVDVNHHHDTQQTASASEQPPTEQTPLRRRSSASDHYQKVANGTPLPSTAPHDLAQSPNGLTRAPSFEDDNTLQLKRQVIELKTELQRLEASHTALQQKYDDLKQQTQPHHTCQRCHLPIDDAEAGSKCHYHAGEWNLTKQSREFFSLDRSLRDTLRAEKNKRIAAAIRELNWIADGDEEKDGLGTWTCCKKDTYSTEGCKVERNHVVK